MEPVRLEAIHALAEFEALAQGRMGGPAFDYVSGGSWDEITLAENVAAWREFRFLYRVLTDIRTIDVGGSFLGRRSALPVAIAPMAAQGMAHPDGEIPVVRAAAAAGIPFCLATTSSQPMEAVADAAPEAERWFQLYLVRDLGYSRTLVERAAAAGYRAIVLTVDLPVLGYRERDRRSGFELPAMPHVDAAGDRDGLPYGGLEKQHSIGLTWADLDEVRTWSNLPLVVKGMVAPDDARRAAELGVAAIVVSNHGARQLDRSIATADALEAVVEAVNGRTEVWVDGGVRRGLDVLIAIALGASGVLLGRPIFWALAVGGEAGVGRALAILREELELALPLLGCASIADVNRSHLA